MFRKHYSDKDIIEYSKESYSIAELLRKLNLKPAGGNYSNIKRKLQKLNIDTSHWTGKAWNKNKKLKDWSKYTKANNAKKHLINSKGYFCENCQLTQWLGKSITLEIHHKDGDRTNNDYKNLALLCPNCHSQTDNFRNRKLGDIGLEPIL